MLVEFGTSKLNTLVSDFDDNPHFLMNFMLVFLVEKGKTRTRVAKHLTP